MGKKGDQVKEKRAGKGGGKNKGGCYVVDTYSITISQEVSIQVRLLSNLSKTESQALNATQGHKHSYQNPVTNTML